VILSFTPGSDRIVLLIQVSNFHHRRGGCGSGSPSPSRAIARLHERERGLDFFLLAAFSSWRSITWALSGPAQIPVDALLRHLLLSGRPEAFYRGRTVSGADPAGSRLELLVKIEYLSFYLAVPVFGMFIQSLFSAIPRKLLRLVQFLGAVFRCSSLSRRSGFFPTACRSTNSSPWP